MKLHLTHCVKVLSSFLLAVAMLSSSLAPARTVQAGKLSQSDFPQVTLIEPIGGKIIYASPDNPKALPLFEWEAITGATSYYLEINTAANFEGVALYKVHTRFTQWAPTKANLPDGKELFWRVKVESPLPGDEGYVETFQKDWTRFNASTPNTTTLLRPADGAVIAYNDQIPGDYVTSPDFSWTPVIGATFYMLQFSIDESFSPEAIKASYTTMNTTYQLKEKIADGPYFWRVIPYQDGMPDWDSDPSAFREVVFNYNTAFRPALVFPAHGTTYTFTPTFRWTPVRGAREYFLEIDTDTNFPNPDVFDTFATSYTLDAPLLNNQDYFWRVRVESGLSKTLVYSDVRRFRKDWTISPNLLTPTSGYQHASDLFFSWTPVPGADEYRIEVDISNQFTDSPKKATTTNTFYSFADKRTVCPPMGLTGDLLVFWRVIARSNGNDGGISSVRSFTCHPEHLAPVQVAPPFYYIPTLTNPVLNPHEDNTAALPLFQWKRLLNADSTQVAAYRIQVANMQNIDLNPSAVLYTFDTQNMNAIPNVSTLLPHGNGQTDYWWRVRPLTAVGGSLLGEWSQEWRMRYNPALLPPATTTITPLRPIKGSEWVETLPPFEWSPLQGASSYQVQISDNAAFTAPVVSATVSYPAYTHPNRLPAGTYYWRVRAGSGAWSAGIRFQVAAQSRWRLMRTLGANNLPVIATDPANDAGGSNFDLTNLSITQDYTSWYFGFNVGTGANMKYVVYIDTNHVDGSGATQDPENHAITTIADHRPEYVLYLYQEGSAFSRATSRIYTWAYIDGTWQWDTPDLFSQLAGADILYNSDTGYLELVVPGNQIGLSGTVSSMAVSVMSVDYSGAGGPRDSVPSDPNVFSDGRSAQISRFTSVTDQVNLISPIHQADGDPKSFATVPPFYWHPLVEVPDVDFYEMQVGHDIDQTDPNYITNIADDENNTLPAVYTFTNDLEGDETSYYWQVRPNYVGGLVNGWSRVNKFERKGPKPHGLTVTNEQWTPVFTWSYAEGADHYYLQIDDDPAFTGNPVADTMTQLNSFTPDSDVFDDGKVYYARLRIYWGSGGYDYNEFSDVVQFTVQRPAVTGLRTIPAATETTPARYNPTFCWDPIPSAYQYLLEVGWDEAFQTGYFHYYTEQSCFTVPIGHLDGEFFWRVTMVDGGGGFGPASAVEEFWKLYPAPTPLYPLTGVTGTPVFHWTGVNGADTYYLEISDDPEFSKIRYKCTSTVNTWHQPTQDLGFGDYYWRVRMIDRDGNKGTFSDYVHVRFEKIYLPFVRR